MKIAILTHLHYAIREPFMGGMEAHTSLLVDGLVKQGHDVHVFSRQDSDVCGATLHPIVPLHFVYHNPDSNWFKNMFHKLSVLRMDMAMRKSLIEIEHDGYDLVINNTLSKFPLTFNASKPMLTIFHTPPFTKMIKGVSHKNATLSTKIYISVSLQTQQEWSPYVASTVVSNGIDLEAWKTNIKTMNSESYWFWSGRLVPEKGLHLAIKAALYAEKKLYIAGPIGDRVYYEQTIKPLLSDQSITYLGHLPQKTIQSYVSQAAVTLITPCWEEPFGLVVAESLAAGTPVAAFERGSMAELISRSVGTLATPGDIISLAQAAKRSETLSSADCYEHAKQWDFKKMISNYIELGLCSSAKIISENGVSNETISIRE